MDLERFCLTRHLFCATGPWARTHFQGASLPLSSVWRRVPPSCTRNTACEFILSYPPQRRPHAILRIAEQIDCELTRDNLLNRRLSTSQSVETNSKAGSVRKLLVCAQHIAFPVVIALNGQSAHDASYDHRRQRERLLVDQTAGNRHLRQPTDGCVPSRYADTQLETHGLCRASPASSVHVVTWLALLALPGELPACMGNLVSLTSMCV